MRSIYETTNQGRNTRSQLLNHISPGEELTREQFMSRANLTYDQVRRQTKNLSIQGMLQSRIEDGKRVYKLRAGGLIIALLVACSITVNGQPGSYSKNRTAQSNYTLSVWRV
jgi:hypothetical protein